MTVCSLELGFFYVTSGEITVHSSKLIDCAGKTQLFIMLFKLAQLVKFYLALI